MNPVSSPALVVRAVTCHGVGPFSLSVCEGECLALSGPSGVGKSLLLRAIADLEPHQGSVSWNGIDCDSVSGPEWRRKIGYLAAESAWWGIRVEEHFADPQARERLADMGFQNSVWSSPVADLSTGERQRLALLRTLANEPEVLLLDEPTASLDPENTSRVERLITDFRKQHGTPILWVSHDPQQIARIADRHCVVCARGLEPKGIAA